MKVSGFTFIKDAVKYDFPIKESILSVLPLCDEFIVGVGESDDGTLELIKTINDPKLKIIESPWGEAELGQEHIFAKKTNDVLEHCTGDWCFYIQGDEVLNDVDYDKVYDAMKKYLKEKSVEGFLFHYRHFFGSPNMVIDSYHWYQNEIRIIRNGIGIRSWRDAQGFRKADGSKLRVKHTGAYIHHYGWARDPNVMLDKAKKQWTYYHSPEEVEEHFKDFTLEKLYSIDLIYLKKFTGNHPKVIQDWVQKRIWDFDPKKISFKHNLNSIRKRIQHYIWKLTGLKIAEYKNYILVR